MMRATATTATATATATSAPFTQVSYSHEDSYSHGDSCSHSDSYVDSYSHERVVYSGAGGMGDCQGAPFPPSLPTCPKSGLATIITV
jgi:hypothetical protein